MLKPLRAAWSKLTARGRALLAPGKFLCDSCKYDLDRACHRPERPNATLCDGYRKR